MDGMSRVPIGLWKRLLPSSWRFRTVMMVAMDMLPGATPMILIFTSAQAHRAPAGTRSATMIFIAGYFVIFGQCRGTTCLPCW